MRTLLIGKDPEHIVKRPAVEIEQEDSDDLEARFFSKEVTSNISLPFESNDDDLGSEVMHKFENSTISHATIQVSYSCYA